MSLIVQKFGGTSVGSVERIQNVAKRVLATRAQGHQVIVVVSAMAGETDRLVNLAKQIHSDPIGPEMDMLIATGEQVTVSLLAMTLQQMNQPARSFLGSQVKILTDDCFCKARIQNIDVSRIMSALEVGQVPVVAGFQGVTEQGDITTLGRGGSDTSAVAIAAATKADLCEIYTDVDGVYTADPRICPNARKHTKISYAEMIELASLGSKVLQIRSVELAAAHNVKLVVRSSFNNNEGTVVMHEEEIMEKMIVSGVTVDKNDAKVCLLGLPNQSGICMQVFSAIAEANINVDMIIHNPTDGHADLSFTVPAGDLDRAQKIIFGLKEKIHYREMSVDRDIAKVSIVGLGMRSHVGVAAKAFTLLAQNNINIDMISTSEIKLSMIVKKEDGDRAVRALHDGYQLNEFPF